MDNSSTRESPSPLVKVLIGAVVLYVLYIVFKDQIHAVVNNMRSPVVVVDNPGPPLTSPGLPLIEVEAPLRPTVMSDCGYSDQPRGWYDVKNRGYRNDFCRHVGDQQNSWWSCVVQGETDAAGNPVFYSQPGRFTYDANTPHDEYKQDLTGWHCP